MNEKTAQNPFQSRGCKLGLALSGGGFRASLFHIGVLARLAELDLLKNISVLSTVSGGSIIGAAYYLKIKELLEGKRADGLRPCRDAYVTLVRELERDFLAGVQQNIRMRTFLNPLKNLKMLFEHYTRSDRIAELYRDYFYDPIWDRINAARRPGEPERCGEILLRDLKILPSDDLLRGPAPGLAGKPFEEQARNFDVAEYNEAAEHKVPVLAINATTLNSCHNWQFTSSWVGEPPPPRDDSYPRVDFNRRLERLRFDGGEMDGNRPDDSQLEKLKTLTLGDAVASSAAVPGIFHPFAIHDLYFTANGDEIVVQLVDGGVFDNQGLSALADARCTHIVCSDASGQTEDSRTPSPRFYSVLSRSNDILMDRVREQGLESLFLRDQGHRYLAHCAAETGNKECDDLRAGLLNHLDVEEYVFFYLRHEFQGSDEFPAFPSHRPGHPRAGQPDYYNGFYYLSNIRTDLDSFTDIEACSLMYDGYCLCGDGIVRRAQLFTTAPTPEEREATGEKDWGFFAIREPLTREPENILFHLRVGSNKLFKVWRLMPRLRRSALALLAVLGVFLLWQWLVVHPNEPVPGVEPLYRMVNTFEALGLTVVMIALYSALYLLPPTWRRIARLRGLPRRLALAIAVALFGWIVVRIHLAVFDRLFLKAGKL